MIILHSPRIKRTETPKSFDFEVEMQEMEGEKEKLHFLQFPDITTDVNTICDADSLPENEISNQVFLDKYLNSSKELDINPNISEDTTSIIDNPSMVTEEANFVFQDKEHVLLHTEESSNIDEVVFTPRSVDAHEQLPMEMDSNTNIVIKINDRMYNQDLVRYCHYDYEINTGCIVLQPDNTHSSSNLFRMDEFRNGQLVYEGCCRKENSRYLRDGEGIEYDNQGKVIYAGEWKDGRKEGKGRMFQDETVYEGGLKSGLPHGEGELKTNLGETFQGLWRSGYFKRKGLSYYDYILKKEIVVFPRKYRIIEWFLGIVLLCIEFHMMSIDMSFRDMVAKIIPGIGCVLLSIPIPIVFHPKVHTVLLGFVMIISSFYFFLFLSSSTNILSTFWLFRFIASLLLLLLSVLEYNQFVRLYYRGCSKAQQDRLLITLPGTAFWFLYVLLMLLKTENSVFQYLNSQLCSGENCELFSLRYDLNSHLLLVYLFISISQLFRRINLNVGSLVVLSLLLVYTFLTFGISSSLPLLYTLWTSIKSG